MPPKPLPSAGRALAWLFLALTFVVTMLGYADRQFLALLKPALDTLFGWSSTDYGNMTTAFQISIAVSLLGAGWFLDRVGLRWGFAIGLGGWSLAAGLHAVARTVPEFIAARVALGVFEAVGTPSGMKSLATFFPASQRTLVIGIANIAPNLANVVTPLFVTWMYLAVGWQGAVVALAGLGFVCVALWLALPLRRMAVQDPEAAEHGAKPGRVLADRGAWALAGAKLLTDQAWWFMLFWLPDYLAHHYGLDMRHLGAPVATIYAMAALGSLLGGLMPRFLAPLMRPVAARFTTLFVFAVLVTPIAVVMWSPGLWSTVAIVGLALLAHQGFATNVFGLAADLFPAARIGTVIGFAAFFGNMGGAVSAHAAGALLAHHMTLQPMFLACASGYLLAWVVLFTLTRNRLAALPAWDPAAGRYAA
jgi:ACS family hexuronate transporter-like MFS transporter